MRSFSTILLAAAITACSSPVSQAGYGPAGLAATRQLGEAESREDDPSLFKSDTDVLSDSAIRRILDYQLRFPGTVRLAVLQLAERSLTADYWSRVSRVPASVPERLLDSLRQSPRVSQASFLPSLLVPRDRAVGHLREAAARYQADLLLVYRTDCRSFERYRFLAASEVKAVCVVESVLIDTRTGIVPFTAAIHHEFEARKSHDDDSFAETLRRAEVAAIEQGLDTTAGRVVAFLAQAQTVATPERPD